MDTIWLHQLEAPLQDERFMLFKNTNHFIALYDFINVLERNCENPRIVWLHRNTFDRIKSTTAIMMGIQQRFEKDIGTNDFVAFNKITVEWTEWR